MTNPRTTSHRVLESAPTFADEPLVAVRPVVVEVVGPAGVGKTQLTSSLQNRNLDIQVLRRFRKGENAALIAQCTPRLVGQTLAYLRPPGPHSAEVLHSLLFLSLMETLVDRRSARNPRAIVVDEGPIFMMAKLATMTVNHRVNCSIERAIACWSRRMHLVVMLDAPNGVLVDRIRTRAKNHIIKNARTEDMIKFLDEWRTTIDQMCGLMSSTGDVKLVRYDTSERDPASISEELIGFL